MKVVSLFDGISCGRVALERAGLPISHYVAYEIDVDAVNCSKWNWPDIEHFGDVELAEFTDFKGYDLVIGGFPCTDLSIGKNNREGLKGKHSRLFWELVRAIKEINPRYFLVENNYRMPKKDEAIITEALGVSPIHINSALVSAQNRDRLYWTNIPNVEQPIDRGIYLSEILESKVPAKYYHKEGALGYLANGRIHRIQNINNDKSNTLTAGYSKGVPLNAVAVRNESTRVATLGKDSQGNRVYDINGKSITISATSGGIGRNTGLYAIPATGVALRSWPRNTKSGRYKRPETRYDEKANALTSVQTDSMAIIDGGCYKVENGILFFKDKEVPIKLPDGYYAIRKLTPVECERLQTLPDGYTEMLSDTQRYKALGNGWNVDTIAHIFNYINIDLLI